ncbi:unnamed protein product [Phytophthora fragariaefolia]|uniref:Unnamed protein product n=1 Tax=Phytophthora fragariaefolia TaxID=1490495 RepID=A0A9W6WV94_9STRA|nr:unnamed protein product [Phytophthora fragariaefolia]
MSRSGRPTSQATPRLRWMVPASAGDLSPMDRLVAWLERNGEEYRASKRKVGMLDELVEEMATNGIYGVKNNSIRSQISRLKAGVLMKAEGGKCTLKDVNIYFDRLLDVLFDDEEKVEMRKRSATRKGAVEPGLLSASEKRASRQTLQPRQEGIKTESEATNESESEEDRGSLVRQLPSPNFLNLAPTDAILDTVEIRRRFELLSARQGLQTQGVDPQMIDSFLPLH